MHPEKVNYMTLPFSSGQKGISDEPLNDSVLHVASACTGSLILNGLTRYKVTKSYAMPMTCKKQHKWSEVPPSC
jgi:hypothetical protein